MSAVVCAQWVSRKLAQTGIVSACNNFFGTSSGNPEVELDTMCCCVPLRTAVFLNAFFTVCMSAILITSKSWFEDEFRPFQGGYARSSSVVIEVVELTGFCWGSMGVIGAVMLKSSFIEIYFKYQAFRIICSFYMYWTDLPLLLSCERWRTDLYGAIEEYGWNPTMYKIAMANRCYSERQQFVIFSSLYLCALIYFAIINRRLCQTVEDEPKYLLKVPKNAPNGAFYSYSSGMARDKPKKKESTDPGQGALGMMGAHGSPGMMGAHSPLLGPPMGAHGAPGMMGAHGPPGMMGPGMMHPPMGTVPPGMMGAPMH